MKSILAVIRLGAVGSVLPAMAAEPAGMAFGLAARELSEFFCARLT